MTKKMNGAAALTRAAILDADDLPREKVEVPEWGGYVYVRTMTGAERDRYEFEETTASENRTPEGARARLLIRTVVDENGQRLFTEKDVQVLSEKSSAALDRCQEVAARLNRLTAADMEFLIKNLLAARKGDSSSGSPSPSGKQSASS